MFGLRKIISAKQTRLADAYTIENEPVSSIDLMERASTAFVNEILQEDLSNKKIAVVCGVGNNGGDGLAVARILQSHNIEAQPFLIQFKDKLSDDCQINFNRLEQVTVISSEKEIPDLSSFDLIIDALLGTGLQREAEGFVAQTINAINASGATVYAIDIPSGLFCDEITNASSVVQSDLVVSFQRPKKAFFFPENNAYIQQWRVVDIGLDEKFIQQQESHQYVLDEKVSLLVKSRKRYSHKGSYGHALMISGAYGMMGAAVLTSEACLRSGAGLVSSYVPKCGYEILQTSLPEAMCLTDTQYEHITSLPELEKYNAIGIGPGLGTNPDTIHVVSELFERINVPVVLDADALNILSTKLELIAEIPKNAILTPHIKEFDRMVGFSVNAQERFQKQQQFSKEHQCIVVLKDAHTSISDAQGNLFFNTSGNPGMATGGSGDVLTGIITGLLAQSYSPIEAALIGVYHHGLAGDVAAWQKGQYSMIASDIINNLRIA
ncbi:NAD(P)H-hydrate dehydratase [Pseudotenacibaculum haliotis]|uniref:Bifunctional NAD(P)H-hydrate repair enzyme n=1 Tax=Pseudotenacibaculum haliotis TaxID=1862138 RepID=A0ABW5LSX8_9FLAO